MKITIMENHRILPFRKGKTCCSSLIFNLKGGTIMFIISIESDARLLLRFQIVAFLQMHKGEKNCVQSKLFCVHLTHISCSDKLAIANSMTAKFDSIWNTPGIFWGLTLNLDIQKYTSMQSTLCTSCWANHVKCQKTLKGILNLVTCKKQV